MTHAVVSLRALFQLHNQKFGEYGKKAFRIAVEKNSISSFVLFRPVVRADNTVEELS